MLLVISGLVTSGETQFTLTEIIESPATVVWRTLIDLERIPEWDASVAKVQLANASVLKKGSEIDYYGGYNRQEIIYKERIVTFVPDKKIIFRDVNYRKIPLQSNYIRDYSLKSLLDGSTELSITVHYTCGSLITRIMERIYLRGHTMSKHRKQLNSLKRYIENL
jgi:uncharacterized protein YndB with AHSA1/START domain